MVAIAQANRSSSGVPKLSAVLAFWLLMSRLDDVKQIWEGDELSLREKFEAYLEGYMMAFDLYPVCEKQLFMRNDLHALLSDFFAVGHDMNKATQQLLSAPDEEFADTGIGADELRQRRIEAAKRTLAAIGRSKPKSSGSE